MSLYKYEDERDRRLAAIRSLRGTPERLALIEAQQDEKKARQRKPKSAASSRKTPENSADYFGHPWPEWFHMRDAALSHIVRCASERRMTTYGELWAAIERELGKELGNHWRQLPMLLGYVCEAEFGRTRLLPTALVIYDETEQHPGDGFFRIAAGLGALDEDEAPRIGTKWEGMTEPQRIFWDTQVNLLFEHYAG